MFSVTLESYHVGMFYCDYACLGLKDQAVLAYAVVVCAGELLGLDC